MKLTVTDVDYNPPELTEQTPFSVTLDRMMPGQDRSDYWLGALDKPLRWVEGDCERTVEHLVVCARWQGTRIEPLVQNLPLNIAYVVDATQLDDDAVDFAKCRFVAIGTAYEAEGGSAPQGPREGRAGYIVPAFGVGRNE